MQINARNESNQAGIERLQASVDGLNARLAKVEPQPKAAKPDLKALQATASARDELLRGLKARFKERAALLQRLDETIDALVEYYRAEKALRGDILTGHGPMIEKELRRGLTNDHVVISLILTKLGRGGIGQRVISHDVQPVASHISLQTRILQQLEAAEIDELLA